MFTCDTTIRMHHTDAVQRLFFANIFVLTHEAWESALEATGLSLSTIIDDCDFITPVVHAESDYKAPLLLGDRITISVSCRAIGNTSFTIGFEIAAENKSVGSATHVHVAVSKATGQAIPIPAVLRDALTQL